MSRWHSSFSIVDQLREARRDLCNAPAMLNMRSTDPLEAGIPRYILANFDSFGRLLDFDFQHDKGSTDGSSILHSKYVETSDFSLRFCTALWALADSRWRKIDLLFPLSKPWLAEGSAAILAALFSSVVPSTASSNIFITSAVVVKPALSSSSASKRTTIFQFPGFLNFFGLI